MMNERFLTASELVDMQLPILPKSRQGIESRAKNENWQYELAVSRGRNGGTRKYAFISLPTDIQAAIKEKQAAQILASTQPAPLPSMLKKQLSATSRRTQQIGLPLNEYNNGLTEKQRDVAYARMTLCAEVNKMHHIAGLGSKEAVQYIINQIESGALPEHLTALIEVANARKNNSRGLSFSTLYNWVRLYKTAKTPTERLTALSPKKTRPEIPFIARAWLPDFMSFYANPNNPGVIFAYRQFTKNWLATGKDTKELPSIDTVRRVLKKMPVIAKERGRKTGAAYKSLLPYVKRDWLALSPNDVWIGDGHSFKAKIAHPDHGRPFKPEVTMIVDCCRMIVGFSVSLAESTVAVADALRIGIKNFGLPLIYYSDNGGGQTGKMIDHEVTGYCARLGIHHETGIPGNPQGRGIIEGIWDSTLIALAKEYETYTGRGADSSTKNTMYRKLESAFNAEKNGKELTLEQRRYKSKLPRWKQFIADVARCIDEYNNRPHRSLPKHDDGIYYTPAEYREERLKNNAVEINYLSFVELDTLFMPEIVRTTSRGLVSLLDNSYFHVDLAEHHGEQVRVSYDLHDYKHVIVRTMTGKFICKAVFEGNKRDAMPKPLMQQLKEKRVKNIIRRKEDQIEIAKAELSPAIEHQPDFGLLVSNGDVFVQKDEHEPLFMFESDREEWLKERKNHG